MDKREVARELLKLARMLTGASYRDYVKEADTRFLEEAANGIKKIAGRHAERVAVTGTSVALLVYTGEDSSDIPLEVTFSVYAAKDGDAVVMMFTKSAYGNHDEDFRVKQGVLTSQFLVDKFRNVFGA